MSGLYRSPLRVYLALALLSFIGIWSATQLPISLFPNSAKPWGEICIGIDLAPSAFLRGYGESIENQLRGIRRGNVEIEKLVSEYTPKEACYELEFKWGGDPQEARREIEMAVASIQGRLPPESRDRINYWSGRSNGGFFAASFYSKDRSLTETYKMLEPAIAPKLGRIDDAKDPELYNPQQLQILVELNPEALANFQILPSQVAAAVIRAVESYSGGSITVDTGNILIDFPRATEKLEDFRQIQVRAPSGRSVSLEDLAQIDLTLPLNSSQIFKTSGTSSLILFSRPKPGGNVKAMAEGIKSVIEETLPSLPKDIEYKVLVDPSEFIRSAVNNVAKEVALAAGLAVIILFLFVGNLKNVVTAAIEIPLSLVLAFIMMKLSGMNLNLISLGGLALSAGMNVDASVVVMENIFRHFEMHEGKKLSYEERWRIIVGAVKEVQFAVIASTIASLVVFLPLAFTSDLSYAILGDLAKAVVFSHGFSAVVALILVPTIRLHIMKEGMSHESPSVLEGFLRWLENSYARALGMFMERPRWKYGAMASLAVLFALLIALVAPRLPREVIGKPDTDWLIFGVNTNGNTLMRQMEAQTEEVENKILQLFGDRVLYTFTQINRVDSSFIMIRLKDKREVKKLWKLLEEKFPNTPLQSYWSEAWNPSELPLPNPPDFEVVVRGSDLEAMRETARDLKIELEERKLFQRVRAEPNVSRDEALRIRPRVEQWPLLAAHGASFSLYDLADLTRTATNGRTVTKVDLGNDTMDVVMRFPGNYVSSPEELSALPVGIGSRILPLKALAQVGLETKPPAIRRENGRDAYVLGARGEKDEAKKTKEAVEKAKDLVERWPQIIAERKSKLAAMAGTEAANDPAKAIAVEQAKKEAVGQPVIQIEDSQKELNSALKQLSIAVSLSILLIFLTMVFQFGSVMNSLLVLVAVPLGFIGVLISLFVFQSTLSLNSMLGVILLNGLAVANSIILVDFLAKKVKEGMAPKLAAVEVARVRLRPILMTSMTTGLGMLPIAFGFGEGGKILQPLGIAVAGGLLFSMTTTLFIVPSLQVSWMELQARRAKQRAIRA